MVRFYLSPLIGLGLRLDPFRPVVTTVLTGWGGCDGRADATRPTGAMLISADVTDRQHLDVMALVGVTLIETREELPVNGKRLDYERHMTRASR